MKTTLGLVMAGLCLGGLIGVGMRTHESRALRGPERGVQRQAEPAPGVEILGVHLTAGGYMLDFRYRVTDPEKALPLMSSAVKPYLLDQASGAKLMVPASPKFGAMRQVVKGNAQPRRGNTYFVLFANPGKVVKSGGLVTVHVGDIEFSNISVT